MATSLAPSFDFVTALNSLDPHHTYTTTVLTGGLVNLTSRVTVSSDAAIDHHECLFGKANSVIAKYAPPYVAALGESAHCDPFRQVIEARALQLLSHPSAYALIHANAAHNVSIPVLVYHNSSAHVLIMSDLGSDSLTLDHWLLSACLDTQTAATAGARFGSFFAALGRLGSLDAKPDFTNQGAHEMVFQHAVQSVRDNLLQCEIDFAEADILAQSAVDMFKRQSEANDKVFSLGDCWPKSLMILPGDGLAVIDWEFAGMNSPLQDVAQLAAHLFILQQTSPPSSRAFVQAFAFAFYHSHFAQAPAWYYQLHHRVDAWRLFGREIVNNVVEGSYWNGSESEKPGWMKRLGRKGSEFMGEAEQNASAEHAATAPLFESCFMVS